MVNYSGMGTWPAGGSGFLVLLRPSSSGLSPNVMGPGCRPAGPSSEAPSTSLKYGRGCTDGLHTPNQMLPLSNKWELGAMMGAAWDGSSEAAGFLGSRHWCL